MNFSHTFIDKILIRSQRDGYISGIIDKYISDHRAIFYSYSPCMVRDVCTRYIEAMQNGL